MDLLLFQTINNMAGKNKILDTIMIFSSVYGMYLFLAAVLLLFFTYKKPYAIWGLMGSALALLINWLFSLVYYRTQPFVEHNVNLLVEKGVSSSLPSDTVAIVFACATALILAYRKKWLTTLVLFAAVLIAFSRVFVGHHYPLDVLSGAVVGVLAMTIVLNIKKIWEKNRVKRNPLSQ